MAATYVTFKVVPGVQAACNQNKPILDTVALLFTAAMQNLLVRLLLPNNTSYFMRPHTSFRALASSDVIKQTLLLCLSEATTHLQISAVG